MGVLEVEAIWAVLLVVALAAILLVRGYRRRRAEAALAAAPAIREALTTYIGGNDDLTVLRRLGKAYRPEMEENLIGFQNRLGGKERERLADLAIRLSYVARWCEAADAGSPEKRRRSLSRIAALSHSEAVRRLAQEIPIRALSDQDELARLEAFLLIHSDNREHIEKAFDAAFQVSPLSRVRIAPMLRKHAMLLSESAIPKALRTGHAARLISVLKLLTSWECSLPICDLSDVATHPDADTRLEAMRLLAHLPLTVENRRSLLDGLVDEDTRVCAAAAVSCGRLRLPAALPRLAGCLRRHDEVLAMAAAGVLAQMPPLGRQCLQDHLESPDPIASRVAARALELAGSGFSEPRFFRTEVA